MTYAAGIDVGTTFSAAATWRDGRATTVALGDRAAAVPSVLYLREDGTMLVGDAAVRRAVGEPRRVAREFKRRVGDAVPVVLGDQQFGAAQLTTQVVRWVADKVAEREGAWPAYAVLTHPASWGSHRRSVLAEAAATAGLPDAGLLAEPIAAGLYYASQQRVPAGALVAVYDFGGGTCDAALLRKSATSFELVGTPRGHEHLGGVDIDQAVLDHVVAAVGERWPELDDDDPVAMSALAQVRAAAVDAKEALSSDTQATVPVVLPGCTDEVGITRTELERMVAPVVLRTVDLIRQTWTAAGVGPDEVDAVLLVGGGSRMPLVAELVTSELGRPVAVDAHPKYAVCLGAAIAAAARLEDRPPAPASPARLVSPPPPPPAPPAPPAPAVTPVPAAEVAGAGPPTVAITADLASSQLTGASDLRLPRSRRPPDPPLRLTDRDDRLVVRIGAGTADPRVERGERRRLAGLAAAAAVVVAATLGGLAAWGSRGASEPGGPSAGPVGPAGRESAEPVAPGGTAALAGGPVPVASTGGTAESMLGATVGPDGRLVAVGAAGAAAVAWTSADGGATWAPAWSAAPDDAPAAAASGVTTWADGLVAVGWVAAAGPAAPGGDPPAGAPTPGAGEPDGDSQAAVWRSAGGDPSLWERLRPSGLEGAAALHDVVADGTGVVAVGRDLTDDTGDGDGGVWRSDDGVSWRRIATTGLGGPGRQELHRVMLTDQGRWIAVGRQMRGASTAPAVWVSDDLSSWAETGGHPGAGGDGAGGGVPSVWGLGGLDGGGLVAAGTRPGLAGDPAGAEAGLWLDRTGSADRWHPLDIAAGAPGRGPGDQHVRALLRTPSGGLVALGADGTAPAAWTVTVTPAP
ncbi:MAG TPA: Hsp70 family protein [Acidimicrobiales bacterium]|nr:Hsp70 family protein [Acidimicrobiales bacterium]